MGARFAVNSHPVVAALRFCDKGNGTSVAMIDFSERINYVAGEATIGLVGSAASFCLPDPALSNLGTTQSVRLICKGLPPKGSRFHLTLAPSVTSPSGGALESPGGTKGTISSEIDVDSMASWGQGCSISRPC